MKLQATNNITLENVRKSNYWELIALIVWNHYREKKFQEEENVIFSEEYYGKGKGMSSHSSQWNDPNFTEGSCIRTLGSIRIKFIRSDYTTFININVETGNIYHFAIYNDKGNNKTPHHYPQAIDLMNWMLEHEFIELV